jgi:AraC family transcriptional regulator
MEAATSSCAGQSSGTCSPSLRGDDGFALRSGASAAARGGLAPYRLRRVLERIEASLGEELSLAHLSAEAGLNLSHFSRAFKQSMGVAPHRHLVRRRLERARDLLATTDLPILQVALEVGYGSQSHFTTAFRRAIGLTPRRYRSRVVTR